MTTIQRDGGGCVVGWKNEVGGVGIGDTGAFFYFLSRLPLSSASSSSRLLGKHHTHTHNAQYTQADREYS